MNKKKLLKNEMNQILAKKSILIFRPELGGVQGTQPGRASKYYRPQTKN